MLWSGLRKGQLHAPGKAKMADEKTGCKTVALGPDRQALGPDRQKYPQDWPIGRSAEKPVRFQKVREQVNGGRQSAPMLTL